MGQDEADIEFLYDFVYLDRPRIASYYAQMFEEGVLLQFKQTEQSQKGRQAAAKGSVAVASTGLTFSDATVKSGESLYDSSWTIPIDVINEMDGRGFLSRDISSTPSGQLVLMEGALQIMDIRMLKGLWKPLVNMNSQSILGNTHKKKHELKNETDMLVEILGAIPHALQMRLIEDGRIAWATLDPEHMTINTDDLAFKHGSRISGKWMTIAIVDAQPDAEPDHNLLSLPTNDVHAGMFQMLDAIREFLGRPTDAFGITPIAIFRPLRKA